MLSELLVIHDYIDLQKTTENNYVRETISTEKMSPKGRPRTSTMEGFENFEGETSSDPVMRDRGNSDSNKEAKKIKEEHESYITLISHKRK